MFFIASVRFVDEVVSRLRHLSLSGEWAEIVLFVELAVTHAVGLDVAHAFAFVLFILAV